MRSKTPTGIGLGLRGAFLESIAAGEADGRVAFLEVAPENYMRRGGSVPARLEQCAARFPILSHGLTMSLGGTDAFDADYFAALRDFLNAHDPPWHSDHLCFSGMDGVLLHDLLPVPMSSSSARRIAARIDEARDRLQRPMAVENISYYLALEGSPSDEPAFLTEVLERADCALLLDVNNVFVNARNHGFDPYEWLARVPLSRVVQLHVAGHETWDDGLIIDTHAEAVRDEVHDLMSWVIARTGPLPVLLERDADVPPLQELLEEVQRLRDTYECALAQFHARTDGAQGVPT